MQEFVLFLCSFLHMQKHKQRDGWAASALQSRWERERLMKMSMMTVLWSRSAYRVTVCKQTVSNVVSLQSDTFFCIWPLFFLQLFSHSVLSFPHHINPTATQLWGNAQVSPPSLLYVLFSSQCLLVVTHRCKTQISNCHFEYRCTCFYTTIEILSDKSTEWLGATIQFINLVSFPFKMVCICCTIRHLCRSDCR